MVIDYVNKIQMDIFWDVNWYATSILSCVVYYLGSLSFNDSTLYELILTRGMPSLKDGLLGVMLPVD